MHRLEYDEYTGEIYYNWASDHIDAVPGWHFLDGNSMDPNPKCQIGDMNKVNDQLLLQVWNETDGSLYDGGSTNLTHLDMSNTFDKCDPTGKIYMGGTSPCTFEVCKNIDIWTSTFNGDKFIISDGSTDHVIPYDHFHYAVYWFPIPPPYTPEQLHESSTYYLFDYTNNP